MKAIVSSLEIDVAAPCPARWEDMGGSDRVRFCNHCQKNVYNISALTSAEATALLNSGQGNLCARIYRRVDGTVITQDCPVGVARHTRRLKILITSGVAIILLTLVNLRALMSDGGKSARGGRLSVAVDDLLSKLNSWPLQFPPHAMGKVRATPLPLPVPPGGVSSSNAPALPRAN